MRKKIVVALLSSLLALSTIGTALADNKGPHPQPPKCTPASTPGCSGK
jgi:hypothetical protein